jgi:2-polyprenyl-3-methyl-5-hydroxy-6-metoxy-1,4-benzoquinol methylase
MAAGDDDWESAAATFDDQPDHGLRDPEVRDAWVGLLAKHLPPAPATVLDLGCGTGTLSVLLASLGYSVTGLDSSSRMLAVANEKAATEALAVVLVEGDAAAPSLRGPFDVLLCRHVLWALDDYEAVLGRWRLLLAPNGLLLLIEGQWLTGAGIAASDLESAVVRVFGAAHLEHLTDPRLWGHEISDERYLIRASGASVARSAREPVRD